MSKTIKQLADELGITKSTLRHKIDVLNLQSTLQKVGNQFIIDSNQEKIIINSFKDKVHNYNVTDNELNVVLKSENNIDQQRDTLYDILKSELNSQKAQIDSLNKQILSLMKQNEQLTEALQNMTDSLKSAQALHAGTIQQQLTQSNVEADNAEDNKKWWHFWK